MKSIHYIVFATVVLTMACGGCKQNETSDKALVVAGIPPIAAIVSDIAGSRMDVITVTDAETDPETYEPTVAQRMRMTKAKAYFMAGHLPYEAKLAEAMRADNMSVRIVDTSKGIQLVRGTHVHADGHKHVNSADPHTWTSLRNGIIIATNICEALSDIDPEGAAAYRHNLDSLLMRVRSADSIVTTVLSTAPQKSFIVWHPSLSYFARDYGLNQIVMEQEGKESTPAAMHGAIDQALQSGARVFFIQQQYDSRNAETLSGYLGMRTAKLNPLDADWIEQIIEAANEIANP